MPVVLLGDRVAAVAAAVELLPGQANLVGNLVFRVSSNLKP
jgi:hypothetical protein